MFVMRAFRVFFVLAFIHIVIRGIITGQGMNGASAVVMLLGILCLWNIIEKKTRKKRARAIMKTVMNMTVFLMPPNSVSMES